MNEYWNDLVKSCKYELQYRGILLLDFYFSTDSNSDILEISSPILVKPDTDYLGQIFDSADHDLFSTTIDPIYFMSEPKEVIENNFINLCKENNIWVYYEKGNRTYILADKDVLYNKLGDRIVFSIKPSYAIGGGGIVGFYLILHDYTYNEYPAYKYYSRKTSLFRFQDHNDALKFLLTAKKEKLFNFQKSFEKDSILFPEAFLLIHFFLDIELSDSNKLILSLEYPFITEYFTEENPKNNKL